VFKLVEKIDRFLEEKTHCTLIDKMGRYYHGHVSDSWVRLSGAKLRGSVKFESKEKGEVEIDVNDILDVVEKK